MRPYFCFLAFVAVVTTSCDAPAATVAEPPEPLESSSPCHSVAFTVTAVPTGNVTFVGSLSGDLEGNVSIEFDVESFRSRGNVFSNAGTASWTITGGVVPTPLEFTTTFRNLNLMGDRPGSPATLFENIGTHRASVGIAKANLEYNGTFTLVPTPVANHDYRGVMCL